MTRSASLAVRPKRPIQITYYRQGKFLSRTKEYIYIDYDEPLMEAAKAYINSMNAQNPYLSAMILCGAGEYTPPDPHKKGNHDWQITGTVRLEDGQGIYRNIRCQKCGMRGRQYDNKVEPTIDLHDTGKRFSGRKKNLSLCCERLLRGESDDRKTIEIYGIPVPA